MSDSESHGGGAWSAIAISQGSDSEDTCCSGVHTGWGEVACSPEISLDEWADVALPAQGCHEEAPLNLLLQRDGMVGPISQAEALRRNAMDRRRGTCLAKAALMDRLGTINSFIGLCGGQSIFVAVSPAFSAQRWSVVCPGIADGVIMPNLALSSSRREPKHENAPSDASAGHERLLAAARGAYVVHECSNVASHIITLVQQTRDKIREDKASLRVHEFDMKHPNASLSRGTLSNQALQCNVSRKKLSTSRNQLACVSWMLYHRDIRDAMSCLVKHVKSKGGHLQTLSLFMRCDETPMKLVTVDMDAVWGHVPEEFNAAVCASEDSSIRDLMELVSRASAPTKLLQTEYIVTALFSIGHQYHLVTFRCIPPVQALARTTSHVYFAALQQSETWLGLEQLKAEFDRAQRGSCTDGDGAIGRAERAHEAHHGVASLRSLCVVHKIGTMREDVCRVDAAVIRNVTHVSLSLRFGNHLKYFRTALRRVLTSRIRVIRDRAPCPSARSRNETMLGAFIPNVRKNRRRRLMLLSLLPGDWSDTTHVHAYPFSPDDKDETVVARVVFAVSALLVGSGPGSFPTRNWVRAEESPNWIGAMETIHRMFSQAYPVFCELVGDKPPKRPVPAPGRLEGGDLAVAEDEPMLGIANDVGAAAPGANEFEPPANNAGNSHELGRSADDARKREHATYRCTGFDWAMSGGVLADVLLLSLVLAPHMALMADALFVAGDDWERKQERAATRFATASVSTEAGTSSRIDAGHDCGKGRSVSDRTFRAIVAYEGEALTKFMSESEEPMNASGPWSRIPFPRERLNYALAPM